MENIDQKFIVYYRVSTRKQGDSGLGIEAQKTYINHFLKKEQIVDEFIEIESGGGMERRFVLKSAIDMCIKYNYTLAIAKIDRLSRKTEDALNIYNRLSGKLFSCDIPNLDKFSLTLFMAIADRERELISIRTKQALDEKRKKIGEWRKSKLTKDIWSLGQRRIKEKAFYNINNIRATELIHLYKEKGYTLQQIANKLNQNGFKSSTGKKFHKTTVNRLLKRYLKNI